MIDRTLVVLSCLALAATGPAMGDAEASNEDDVLTWGLVQWRDLSTDQQLAFLSGFVNGAATVEALADGRHDSLAERMDAMRQAGRLPFQMRPHVYQIRLAEHYFWDNHERERLAVALLKVERLLRGGN